MYWLLRFLVSLAFGIAASVLGSCCCLFVGVLPYVSGVVLLVYGYLTLSSQAKAPPQVQSDLPQATASDPAMRRNAQDGTPIDPAVDALVAARDDWYFRHLSGSDENWTFPIANTDVPPPGSDSCLMSDAGEGLAPPALASHPLQPCVVSQRQPPDRSCAP